MAPLVLYHADCADGFGSAVSAWLRLGDEAEYVAVQHGTYKTVEQLFDRFASLPEREVYVLDFSFPRELMLALRERAGRLIWLDHHLSSFEQWCGPDWADLGQGELFYEEGGYAGGEGQAPYLVRLDTRKAGALLAWEHFFPGAPRPRFIAYIDDYDRWALQLPHSREFNLALGSHAPWSFRQWGQWIADFGDTRGAETGAFLGFLAEGKVLSRLQANLVNSVLPDAVACRIKGCADYGLAVACPHLLVNDVGAALLARSGTFALCWTMLGNGQVKCSLRSAGDYDVAAIAAARGGGGHRNSAAFRTSLSALSTWLPASLAQ